jgi:hypothetical protein
MTMIVLAKDKEDARRSRVPPPPRKPLWSDQTFCTLDGTITHLLESEIRTAAKSAFVNIERYTPASREAMIAALGKRTAEHRLPPPGPVIAQNGAYKGD